MTNGLKLNVNTPYIGQAVQGMANGRRENWRGCHDLIGYSTFGDEKVQTVCLRAALFRSAIHSNAGAKTQLRLYKEFAVNQSDVILQMVQKPNKYAFI